MVSIPIYGISDPQFASALSKTNCAILPVGSLEQHGPHLPVSTDSIIVEYISRLVASKIGAFVLPVVAYGVSFEHAPMFNLSINNTTLSSLAADISSSLLENNVKHILIINGHHGNVGALQYISQTVGKYSRVRNSVHILHYWHALKREFDHAGEVETSLLLSIAPELVRMDKAAPNRTKLTKSKAAYASITNIPGSFPKLTGNGVWGDPTKSSAEKGSKMVEEIVDGLVRTIRDLV